MIQKEIKLNNNIFNVYYRDDTDYSVLYEVLLDRDYLICDQVIKNAASCIIDIGAHIGLFDIYVRSLNNHCQIYAFEPYVPNYDVLKMNIKENKLSNCSTSNQAVRGNSNINTNETTLFLSKYDHNHSLFNPFYSAGDTIKVQSININKIFDKFKIINCDLLKMDCEGSEFEILENMSCENFAKVRSIFLEYHENFGRNSCELINILKTNNFKIEINKKSHYSNQLGFVFATKK